MKKILAFATFALVVFAFGCSPRSLLATPTASNFIATDFATTSSTPTPMQAQTPTSTLQLHAVPTLATECVSAMNNAPSIDGVHGTIVFDDWKTSTLLLKRGDLLRIPENSGENNYVIRSFVYAGSGYLGYKQQNSNIPYLVIRQANGSIVKKYDQLDKLIPRRYYWNSIQWQSKNTILVRANDSKKSIKLFLIDISTDTVQELSTDFPQLASGKEINWGIDADAIRTFYVNGANIMYDPSLTHVVYPKTGGIAVLYDVDRKIELASMPLQEANDPQWSPDGTFFLISAKVSTTSVGELGEEFFIVGRDDTSFRQLSWLGDQYPGVSLAAYSWSPDGQHVAFWMKAKDSQEYSLASLDINSGDVINYCITGIASRNSDLAPGLQPGPGVLTGRPIWSPDSTKLLISQFDEAHKHFNVILVDTILKQSFKIEQDLDPIGWLSE